MKKRFLTLMMASVFMLIFFGCSDKNNGVIVNEDKINTPIKAQNASYDIVIDDCQLTKIIDLSPNMFKAEVTVTITNKTEKEMPLAQNSIKTINGLPIITPTFYFRVSDGNSVYEEYVKEVKEEGFPIRLLPNGKVTGMTSVRIPSYPPPKGRLELIVQCNDERIIVTLPEEKLKKDAKAYDQESYFPLKTGNSWEYAVSINGSFKYNRKIMLGEQGIISPPANIIDAFPKDINIKQQPFFVCNVSLGSQTFEEWYATVSNNRILYRGIISSKAWGENVRFNSLIFLQPEMIIGEETIIALSKSFNCIKIERNNACNLDVLPLDPAQHSPTDYMPVDEWYAKGIGMVKREFKLSNRIEYLIKCELK